MTDSNGSKIVNGFKYGLGFALFLGVVAVAFGAYNYYAEGNLGKTLTAKAEKVLGIEQARDADRARIAELEAALKGGKTPPPVALAAPPSQAAPAPSVPPPANVPVAAAPQAQVPVQQTQADPAVRTSTAKGAADMNIGALEISADPCKLSTGVMGLVAKVKATGESRCVQKK